MLNKKGQALIEFVLVLPILIMLIFSMVDFGNMFITKSSLETTLNTVVELYKEDLSHGDIQSKITDQNVSIVTEDMNDGYVKLVLIQNIELITPGLNLIFDNPYQITVERVVKK